MRLRVRCWSTFLRAFHRALSKRSFFVEDLGGGGVGVVVVAVVVVVCNSNDDDDDNAVGRPGCLCDPTPDEEDNS